MREKHIKIYQSTGWFSLRSQIKELLFSKATIQEKKKFCNNQITPVQNFEVTSMPLPSDYLFLVIGQISTYE